MIPPILRRVGASAGDQLATSSTSLVVTGFCASGTSAYQFGVFSFCVAVVLSLQAVSRAVGAETVAITAVDHGPTRKNDEASATAVALAVAVTGSAAVVAAGLWVVPALRLPALGLAIAIFGVITADTRRGLLLSARQPARAMAQSASILAIVLPGGAVLAFSDHAGAWTFLVLWGASSFVASIMFGMERISLPNPARWAMRHSVTIKWLLVEAFSQSISNQVGLMLIAALLLVSDLGAIRGALLVFAPLTLLTQGLALIVPAEVRRLPRSAVRTYVNRALIGLPLLVATAVVLLEQDQVWMLVSPALGGTAEGAQTIVLPIGLYVAGSSMTMIASLALRGSIGATTSGKTRLVLAPVNAIAGPLTALLSGDLIWVAWSLGATQALIAIVWWRLLLRRTRS